MLQLVGDDEAALKNFDQSLKLNESPVGYMYKGMSYMYLGQDVMAKQNFETAIESDKTLTLRMPISV